MGLIPSLNVVPAKKMYFFCDGEVFFLARNLLLKSEQFAGFIRISKIKPPPPEPGSYDPFMCSPFCLMFVSPGPIGTNFPDSA